MKKHGTLTVPSKSPLRLRVQQMNAESAVVEMGVDYSLADVPERAYYADYCDVVKDRQGFTLIFGKLVPGTSKLRTKIEISFPEEMFVRQLWGNSRDFQKIVERLAVNSKVEPIQDVADTDKVQTFRSNNVFMGVWGEESVMDYYYISPKDMHSVMQNPQHAADVTLEPVVRVAIGTGLMLEFLNKCGNFVPQNALAT